MNKYDRRVKARKDKISEGFFHACQLFGISATATQQQLADQPKLAHLFHFDPASTAIQYRAYKITTC